MSDFPSSGNAQEAHDEETTVVSLRLSRQMKQAIKSLQKQSTATGVGDVVRACVRNHTFEVTKLVSPVSPMLDFQQRFNSFVEPDPDVFRIKFHEDHTLIGQGVYNTSFEIDNRSLGSMNDACVRSSWSKSDIMRTVIMKGIISYVDDAGLELDVTLEHEIRNKLRTVQKKLRRQHGQFETFLKVRFVYGIEDTREEFSNTGVDVDIFAKYYKQNFQESSAYEWATEHGLEEALENAEELIEEHTVVTLEEEQ